MIRLVLLTTLIAVALGANLRQRIPRLGGKIVGGKDADIEDYPYQILLEFREKFDCGGSILAPNKILTAAHCTNGRRPEDLRIRAGSSKQKEGGQVIDVTAICQHPNFDAWNYDSDVSVLTLAEDIVYGPGVQASTLEAAGAEDVAEGTEGTVTGWGGLWEGGPTSDILQVVQVPLINQATCQDYYGLSYEVTDNMLCFGYKNGGKDSCQGDSGGPIVADGKQVGVVSWGIGCARARKPGVYAKVSVLRDHIDSC